jgi:AI-2 transport protein TqsA
MEPNDDTREPGSWWSRAGTLPRLAIFLLIFATSWFLLKELATLLRPLLTATLLCYIILPIHKRLHRRRSRTATILIISGGAILILSTLGLILHSNVIELNEDLPRLTQRAQEQYSRLHNWGKDNLPDWLNRWIDDAVRIESKGAQEIPQLGKRIVTQAASIFLELLVVGLYVIFILFEAKRLASRVQTSFAAESAERIRETVETINNGISCYMRAKVMSSVILALPITVLLLLFGVKFAAAFGLITFLCNFIPYVGSIIAGGSPILFTFLDLPIGWQPVVVAIAIFSWHTASASFIEPTLVGNAVDLSPLVILISLTFWGLCWGIVGMLLAVPLTVAVKIVCSNIDATKGIAELLGNTHNAPRCAE